MLCCIFCTCTEILFCSFVIKNSYEKFSHIIRTDPEQWERFKMLLQKHCGINDVEKWETNRKTPIPEEILPNPTKLAKKFIVRESMRRAWTSAVFRKRLESAIGETESAAVRWVSVAIKPENKVELLRASYENDEEGGEEDMEVENEVEQQELKLDEPQQGQEGKEKHLITMSKD